MLYYPETEEPNLDQFTYVEFNNGDVMTEKLALLKNEESTGNYLLAYLTYHNDFCQYSPTLTKSRTPMYLEKL
jgi:hypothetical protein